MGGGSWLEQRVERGIESGVVAVSAGGECVGGGGVVDDASEYPIPLPASPLKGEGLLMGGMIYRIRRSFKHIHDVRDTWASARCGHGLTKPT